MSCILHRDRLDAFGLRPGGNIGVDGCNRLDGVARLQIGVSAGHQQAAIANKNGTGVDHRDHLQQLNGGGALHHCGAGAIGARKEMGLTRHAMPLKRKACHSPRDHARLRVLNCQRNRNPNRGSDRHHPEGKCRARISWQNGTKHAGTACLKTDARIRGGQTRASCLPECFERCPQKEKMRLRLGFGFTR